MQNVIPTDSHIVKASHLPAATYCTRITLRYPTILPAVLIICIEMLDVVIGNEHERGSYQQCGLSMLVT